jgi:O-antigen/teichoic acid export membrane protein
MMSHAVSRNFAFIAVSNVLAPVFSLVLVLAISRVQGVEMLGKYSLLMSVFVFGMSVAGFGLPVVITREVAQAPIDAGRWFVNAAALSAGIALPLLAVALLACRLWAEDGDMALALGLTALTVLPSAVSQCAEAVLLAYERAHDFVLINLGETVLRAIAGTLLVLNGWGVVAIAVLLLALRAAAAVVFVLVLRRRGVHAPARIESGLLRRLVSYVPVTGLIPIVNALYARADVFLLSSLASWRDVGLYSAALRLVDLARTVTPAYARAMYPVLARLRAVGDAEYAAAARRATRHGLLLTAPLVLVLYGCADLLIRMLFGPDLAPAADTLRILAWAVIPFALAIVLAQVLFAADRQAVDLAVNLASMAVSGIGAVLLIPRFGATGAAVAAVAASTAYANLKYAGAVRWAVPLGMGADLGRLALAMGGALLVLHVTFGAGPIIAMGLALVTLAGLVAAFGLVRVAELRRRLGWGTLPAAERERVVL